MRRRISSIVMPGIAKQDAAKRWRFGPILRHAQHEAQRFYRRSLDGRAALSFSNNGRFAIYSSSEAGIEHAKRMHIGREHGFLIAALIRVLLSQANDGAHRLRVEPGRLGLREKLANIARQRRLFLLQALDALDIGAKLLLCGLRDGPVAELDYRSQNLLNPRWYPRRPPRMRIQTLRKG